MKLKVLRANEAPLLQTGYHPITKTPILQTPKNLKKSPFFLGGGGADLLFTQRFAYYYRQCFFFYVKIKVMHETVFLPFFDFFHARKRFFTHSFQENFTDSMKFSRTLFINFSRIGYFFSRVLFEKISRIGYYFHGQKL